MAPELFSHHYILISPFWCKQELSHPMEFEWTMSINLCTHLSNKVRCLIAKLIDRQSPLFSAQCLSLYIRIFVRRFFFSFCLSIELNLPSYRISLFGYLPIFIFNGIVCDVLYVYEFEHFLFSSKIDDVVSWILANANLDEASSMALYWKCIKTMGRKRLTKMGDAKKKRQQQ